MTAKKERGSTRDPLGTEEQLEALVARMDALEEENANLRQQLHSTPDGRGMVIPADKPSILDVSRRMVLPALEPSKPGMKVRYASKYSLDERLMQGWELHPTAKSVGDAIPIEIPEDHPYITNKAAARREVAEQSRPTKKPRRVRALPGGGEIFEEYERTRKAGPS